jgi:hypothetical protein
MQVEHTCWHCTELWSIGTAYCGLILIPNAEWDGGHEFQFKFEEWSDSDYAKDTEMLFLNNAPVSTKSKMQSCVTLSVTESQQLSVGVN